ncbi:MarR family winged helix-turn-helix transcriptional regulator [Henriciella litoralis]|uniref:MarR family winged helix-turn-helix transcriptional regulator n=1 Tax=Henriciella litoralis TaxID=568102 RepID=UPI000A059BFC|nr:MarR family transcriptional regulator [Henriciella litoralis]
MFFLKDLPTRDMIERYAATHAAGRAGDIQRTLNLMGAVSRLIRTLDAFFAAHDFSQLKFMILMVIDRELETDSLTFSQIASKIDVSRPVLSRTVASLLDAGFLLEQADKQDGRVRHLSISPDGRSKLETLWPEYFTLLTDRAAKEGLA